MHSPILGPVIAMAAWTMVMFIWMYLTRLPAMRAAKMKPDPMAPRGEQMATLPARTRWKADNYNHLMEMPTVFYAVGVALALADAGGGAALYLAWAFVGLRVAHSIVQSTWNKIEVRFSFFALSSFALMGMTAIGLRATVFA